MAKAASANHERQAAAEPLAQEAAIEPVLRASIYEELRRRMITGKITPGVGLSTRGLALEMGVSQMPVRDALSRLAAEGAVAIRSKRRIEVPAMSAERFNDLLDCRLLLEPEAAVLALPQITPAKLKQLREIDQRRPRWSRATCSATWRATSPSISISTAPTSDRSRTG